jgi:ATP-dependent Clp protease ATP-binding subunit ClpC
MPVERYPVLVWQDAHGQFTACDVQYHISAAGESRADVLTALNDYFQYMLGHEGAHSEVLEASLTHYRVPVRPEYRDEAKRVYAADPIGLLVPCVVGKMESGMRFCALPTLGVGFNYNDDDTPKESVAHYVQQALREQTPEQVARYLPPQNVTLEEVLVRTPRARTLKTPFKLTHLEAVADPISQAAFRAGIARPWGREAEVLHLMNALTLEKTSLILVGGSGSGKTAVLAEAVHKVEPTFEPLAGGTAVPRFWMTSGSRLIAGMQYLGQWEERLEALIAELTEIRGVLCVESLLGLIRGAGRDPSASIAAFLVPFLQRGELRLVAEATPEELDACRRLLPAIVDCCQLVTIPPMTRDQAIEALQKTAALHEHNRKVRFDPCCVPTIHRLFARFLPYQEFPGAAAEFVTALFDRARREKRTQIGPSDTLGLFVRRTGLPEWLLHDDQPLKRAQVLKAMQQRIIGQDPACQCAADVVTTFKAGLNDPARPLAVLLLAGPTGVGKTELAKTLARYLFGHGRRAEALVRLDMSEYGGPGAAQRLVGAPDGEPSDVIRRVREQPFCVLLLDEIEKAAPEVFDVLLGILDEGRLTDAFGRLTNFRSAIVLMTSNIGSGRREPFGLSRQASASFESEVMAFFRPEFFNRLDRVVTFAPLTEDSVRAIVEKELGEIAAREGLAKRRIELNWKPALVEWVVAHGFDRRYGARPLQRVIEQRIVMPLARFLIRQRHSAGARIEADVVEGKVVFREF